MATTTEDRVVHAESADGKVQVVRYDRQGRWYTESADSLGTVRMRLVTVHDAATQAVAMEQQGGRIFERQPGGKQFDAKVVGCRRKAGVKA